MKYGAQGCRWAVYHKVYSLFTDGRRVPAKIRQGDFVFHCILPQGTSLSQKRGNPMQASKIIKEFDEVKWSWQDRCCRSTDRPDASRSDRPDDYTETAGRMENKEIV